MKYKDKDGNWKELSIKASDTLPIGAIIPFSGTEAPTNWLICDGSQVSRVTYAELFNIIGTKFGEGDGSTTFNLPDLRGRVITGLDTSQDEFNVIGKSGGEKTHTLTIEEMPSHAHSNTMFTMNAIDNNYGFAQGGTYTDRAVGRDDTNQYNVLNGVQNIQNTGGSQAHNNMQPYVTTNYIIKAKQSIGVVGNVVNEKTTSNKDTYSCDYINGIQGIVLYEDNIGTTGDITLNDSLVNYKFIDIEFKNNDGGFYFTQRYYKPNGKAIHLEYSNITSSTRYLFEKIYNCSENKITKNRCNQYVASSNVYGNYDSFSIMTVVGYK